MKYHELHLHDHYSALDGLNTPAEYMSRAVELGMTHLSQTNHGTLIGHREFQRQAKEAGIVPILGMEAYISATDRFDRRAKDKREDGTKTFNHIGVLALNENGLKNLSALSSEAWRSGFYNKPRIDMELLEQYGEDLVVLSGCLGGLLCKSLEMGDYDKAKKTAMHLQRIFGDRFFIEVMGHNPLEINAGLMRISEELGIKPVVTSDCHHARKEDLWVQDAFLILSTKPKLNTKFDFSLSQTMDFMERYNYLYPERKMTFQDLNLHLNSVEEHLAALAKHGIGQEAITNTDIVAKMVGEYPYYEALDLLPDPGRKFGGLDDLDEQLRFLVFKGLKERGFADNPEYVKRAEEELAVIKQMGFSVYFLILADIMEFAREKKIFVGPGRGSGVSSLVNYCLFITNIDPIPYKLLFFRFLDPDRPDWPDVDVDFEVKRRYEIKEYVNRKYGYTSNILTFNLFRGKAAIKAAASVFQVPQSETNRVTKGLLEDAEYSILDVYETSEATAEYRKKYPEVGKLARALEGRIKGVGMHAGGTLLSKEPIENYVPMQTSTDPQDDSKDRVPVAGIDMRDAEKIGLIKMDFLGLNNLTIILEAIDMIEKRTGKRIDPYVDLAGLDDPKVYDILSKGHTKAVFQCEGGPYTNLLIEMGGVKNFEDLVSSNALVRPGAAKSSIGENYVKGKETGEYEFIHKDAEPFTRETFGQILFQEQQMLLCTEVAGMSMREANVVRKAISKKILKDLVVWKPAFIEGLSKKISAKKAEAVWDDLEKSAEYAFNRAHSVGYSLISYWTAWFKVNYPVEYMCAVLNHPSGSDTKVRTMFYLMECKRLGIEIRLPHINKSGVKYSVEGDAIRMGLESVKGIAAKSAQRIIDQGPYESYAHFREVQNKKGAGFTVTAVNALNKVGGASFPDNPRTGKERENFYEILNIPAFEYDIPKHVELQFRPVNEYTNDDTFIICAMVYNIKTGHGWSLVEYVDESGTGASFTGPNTQIEKGNMYMFLVSNNRIVRYITPAEFNEGVGGPFQKYLDKKRLELEDDQYRCIYYSQRTGRKTADAIFTDKDKNLIGAMVFESLIPKARVVCASAGKCRPVFAETKWGAVYVKDFV